MGKKVLVGIGVGLAVIAGIFFECGGYQAVRLNMACDDFVEAYDRSADGVDDRQDFEAMFEAIQDLAGLGEPNDSGLVVSADAIDIANGLVNSVESIGDRDPSAEEVTVFRAQLDSLADACR